MTGFLGLPYDEVVMCDFEFVAGRGIVPRPVCLVARELISGKLHRLWRDDFQETPPYRTDKRTLFVAYAAQAEIGCHIALNWPKPERILCLRAEYLNILNGKQDAIGKGLLDAMRYFGIPGISKDEKTSMHELILAGGPWSQQEKIDILNYCQSDVDPMEALLTRMLPAVNKSPTRFGQALMRGQYTGAVAEVENRGVPINLPLLTTMQDQWDDKKPAIVQSLVGHMGVYDEGLHFSEARFGAWLESEGMEWPAYPLTGHLKLDKSTFRDMARGQPRVQPLSEARTLLNQLKLHDLAVASDGRNRTPLWPFSSVSGRNQPSNTKSIFGPSRFIRNLITPPEGRAIAVLDWSAQEIAIGAYLSQDANMMEAYTSGDPYLALARKIWHNMALTKEDWQREPAKRAMLGGNYGQTAYGLAVMIGCSLIEANHIVREMKSLFSGFERWVRGNIEHSLQGGDLETELGWRYSFRPGLRANGKERTSNSIRNFPMQANGAEMLRLSVCKAVNDGVEVCMSVHDSLAIEADLADIDDAVAATQDAMRYGSSFICGDLPVRVDTEILRPGERMKKADPETWAKVMGLLT